MADTGPWLRLAVGLQAVIKTHVAQQITDDSEHT
jgi:hypothetical protein